ncbi:MAG: hypothetical protein K6U87_08625 [Firmicutes bacterium]|nr:hypothetical protein [Bacillota bacterium]
MESQIVTAVEIARELTVIRFNHHHGLVMAHHSAVGVGPSEGDASPATAREVGYFATRVVVMHVLATGATPVVMVNNLASADPVLREGLERGSREFLAESGLLDLPFSYAHEVLGALPITAMGLTLVGEWEEERFKLGKAQEGDDLFLIGHPLRAPEHRFARNDTIMPSVRHLLSVLPHAHDLIPVGSAGVFRAAEALAETAGLRFRAKEHLPGWLGQPTASLASAFLAALPAGQSQRAYAVPVPVTHVGRLEG